MFPVASGAYTRYVDHHSVNHTDPILLGSAGEAAFMTGLERNADIVFAASYAPLIQVRGVIWRIYAYDLSL